MQRIYERGTKARLSFSGGTHMADSMEEVNVSKKKRRREENSVVVVLLFYLAQSIIKTQSPVRVTQLVPCDSIQVSHNAFQSFLQQSRKYFPRHLAIEIIKVHLYQASDSKTSVSTLCQERYN